MSWREDIDPNVWVSYAEDVNIWYIKNGQRTVCLNLRRKCDVGVLIVKKVQEGWKSVFAMRPDYEPVVNICNSTTFSVSDQHKY